MPGHVLQALGLTFLGAAGTGLGGLMVIAQPQMDFKRLGILQVSPPATTTTWETFATWQEFRPPPES